jgi:beta-lactamase class D
MDERIEKAFETANYMATLSNQKRIIKEEFEQALIYYINGSTFQINTALIAYVNTVVKSDQATEVVFIDTNGIPVLIDNIQKFYSDITAQYTKATRTYFEKYSDIRVKRKIKDIVEL